MALFRTWTPYLLALAVFITYGVSLGHGFFSWDDNILVYQNPIVQEFSLRSIGKAFSSYDPELYVPLTILSFQLEHLIAGNTPFLYHFDNVLLHALNCILVYLFLRKLGFAERLGLFGALLFALHPLQAEPVAWIAIRKDLLAGTFLLLTLLQYMQYREQRTPNAYRLTILLFLLALLSKVTVIGLPLILILIDWIDDERIDAGSWLEKIPFFALSVIFGMIAIAGKSQNIQNISMLQTILLSFKAIAFSLAGVVFPFHLHAIYQQHDPISLADQWIVAALFLVPLILLCVAWSLRWTKTIAFGFALFFLLLAPTFSNFSRIGVIYFAEDRYTYLPLIGLVIALLWIIARLIHRLRIPRSVSTALACLLLLPYSVITFNHVVLWGDNERFFREALIVDPKSPVMHFNLGVVLHTSNVLDEAMHEYAQAITFNPRYADAYANLGLALLQNGEIEKGIIILKKAVEINPKHPHAKDALENAQMLR